MMFEFGQGRNSTGVSRVPCCGNSFVLRYATFSRASCVWLSLHENAACCQNRMNVLHGNGVEAATASFVAHEVALETAAYKVTGPARNTKTTLCTV